MQFLLQYFVLTPKFWPETMLLKHSRVCACFQYELRFRGNILNSLSLNRIACQELHTAAKVTNENWDNS